MASARPRAAENLVLRNRWRLESYSCGDITFSSLDEGAAGRYAYQDVHLKEIVAAQGVCNGSNGPAGNDDCCPHRVLVRKVIRSSAAPPETPLANVAPYLTRPNGLSVDNMVAEPHLLEVKLAATSLLYLRVQLAATGVLNLVDTDLRAVDMQTARNKFAVGSVSLYRAAPTLTLPFSVLLKN